MLRRAIISFILMGILFVNSGAVYLNPKAIEVKNYSKGVHILVENCENIGTFSIGGLYNSKFKKLTFSYPFPWRGTFITLMVGNKTYSNSINPDVISKDGGNFLDLYTTESPRVDDEKISTKWYLPENIIVEQILEAIDNGTKIIIKATNLNDEEITFGVRIHLDTMLGENDGAPIYIPGDGLKSYESEYHDSKLNFRYWKAYNKVDNPSVIATGILEGDDITYPDRLIVSNWKRSMRSDWYYNINPSVSILGDSAVILYYEPKIIKPKETIYISTAYINGEPILPVYKGNFGIAEIITDRIGRKYCPGDKISIKVDVLSRKRSHKGLLELKIINENDDILYMKTRNTSIVNPDSINSIEFQFNTSSDMFKKSVESLQIIAILYHNNTKIDEKTTKIIIDKTLCTKPSRGIKIDIFLLIFLFISLIIICYICYILYSRFIAMGDVEVTKTIDNDVVRIIVKNKTKRKLRDCVIEDKIEEHSELNIMTAGVIRKGEKLIWNIGVLNPNEHVILEYKIKRGRVLPYTIFRWDGGEKKLELKQ